MKFLYILFYLAQQVNLIIEYAGEIMRIQDKELKADITNQLGGLVKLSRRLDQKKKG